MTIQNCYNVDTVRRLAKRRLPSPIFNYIDGGSDDEVTLRRNNAAFAQYAFETRTLVDVTNIDPSTSVFGRKIGWPLFLSPTGMNGLFHHEGELAVIRAAEKHDTIYSLSTLSTYSIEQVTARSAMPKMFQIYVHKDRGLTSEFIRRCREAGFIALCLTVDTAAGGNRERDLRTGLSIPLKLTLPSFMSFAAHPRWCLQYSTRAQKGFGNIRRRLAEAGRAGATVAGYINEQLDASITWKDVEQVIKEWNGPFAIKGISSAHDAKRCADIGATAVMISNHGGRQLESGLAPIDCLPAIANAVGDRMEIILDGGIRRGTDILKALCLGATACSTGRPYLYGLAAAGSTGVDRVLSLLKAEVERDLALLGCTTIADLGSHLIHRVSALPDRFARPGA